MPSDRSVVHASSQGRPRRTREFINRISVTGTMHAFEDLKQAPSLTLVSLRMQDAFPLEVDIIDNGVAALRSSRQAVELLLYVGSIARRRFIQHFRQRALQPANEKFGLKSRSEEHTSELQSPKYV